MSEFDKEAERQKLREKYERDREKRKETERMSQLLLQGATMTNRHCDTCGDPIFRYQGQEFCATCEGRTQESQANEEQPQEAGAQSQAESQATEVADGEASGRGVTAESTDADVATEPTVDAAEQATSERTTQTTPDGRDGSVQADRATVESPETERVGRDDPTAPTESAGQTTGGESATRTATTPHESESDADLGAARASLIRTLTHHARRAEAVEDPRRATDHLTAVREAAEALAALDGRR